MAFAETFKALSDPVRREILNLLKGGRLTAGEIAGQFDMTAATVSYHLSQLKKAGLIFESREKNFISEFLCKRLQRSNINISEYCTVI